jgi:hypothetical protein
MSKKVKISTPRPYIKPNFKLDLHANDNRGKLDVLNLLGDFLIESGFRRKICKKNKDSVKKDVKEDEDMPSSSVQKVFGGEDEFLLIFWLKSSSF